MLALLGLGVVVAAAADRKPRFLEGIVVDRQGKPVAGATLLQSLAGPEPKAANSDADGRFRLDGIWEGKSLVFASKEGFRLFGQVIDGLPQKIELVLARSTEPPRRILKTLPLAMPRPERLALARKLMEPLVKVAQTAKDTDSKLPILQTLARVEPGRLLELLEGKVVSDASLEQMLRSSAAIHLAKESPEDAQAVAESITDLSSRSMVYVRLADASPNAERKLDLLGQALVQARANNEPWLRTCALAMVAKQLLELGRVEQATKVLREGEAMAKQLSVSEFGGYARGVLATELAPVDLAAALELIKDLTDTSEYDRHHGNIAHKIARKQPAEAERVLDMIRKDEQGGASTRDQYAVRVCYRMATADLPRARRIAAGIEDPNRKAHAYGVMAEALVAAQPAVALGFLRDALGELERHVRSGKDTFDSMHNASSVAASLLSVAEKIDPNVVDEFLWRALALRPLAPIQTQEKAAGDALSASSVLRADAYLAAMVARYDRELAGVLFEPAWKAAVRKELDNERNLLVAAALLKPKEAAAVLENAPDLGKTVRSRSTLAGTLVREDAAIWGHLQNRLLGMWKVDDEDLEGQDD